MKANLPVAVGRLRSRPGSRRGGAHHGDPGSGFEFGDGGQRGVVKGVGLAIEISELDAARPADQGIVAASLDYPLRVVTPPE